MVLFLAMSCLVAGPDLPLGIYDHASVRLNNDLIVLGGYNNGRQNSIFKLSSRNRILSWTTLERELGMCKHSFVAIAVPDNYFACEEETELRKIENWQEKQFENGFGEQKIEVPGISDIL